MSALSGLASQKAHETQANSHLEDIEASVLYSNVLTNRFKITLGVRTAYICL